jgi:serine/threonine-protein kinase HipA
MISETFAWLWLPGATTPVVCGLLEHVSGRVTFSYGRSYLARPDAVALYGIPLESGRQVPGGEIHPAFLDSAPDSWGRQLINHRLRRQTDSPGILDYLTEAASDRIGAIDFAPTAARYQPRDSVSTLDDMVVAAERFAAGEPLSPEMEAALFHGTSAGGARPKVTLEDHGQHLIAKLAMRTDTYPVVGAEAAAMLLAQHAGIRAAAVQVIESAGREVLLVERFDRTDRDRRRMLVSAYTILGMGPGSGVRPSYVDLADHLRRQGAAPERDVPELFARAAFNILVGNTDDHARNHAVFWDGEGITLTPAYDVCPQDFHGPRASQAMDLRRDGYRACNLAGLLDAADDYLLTRAEAASIIDQQIEAINDHWVDIADQARLSGIQRELLWESSILDPSVLDGYPAR